MLYKWLIYLLTYLGDCTDIGHNKQKWSTLYGGDWPTADVKTSRKAERNTNIGNVISGDADSSSGSVETSGVVGPHTGSVFGDDVDLDAVDSSRRQRQLTSRRLVTHLRPPWCRYHELYTPHTRHDSILVYGCTGSHILGSGRIRIFTGSGSGCNLIRIKAELQPIRILKHRIIKDKTITL